LHASTQTNSGAEGQMRLHCLIFGHIDTKNGVVVGCGIQRLH
jgi:hypothetical protein